MSKTPVLSQRDKELIIEYSEYLDRFKVSALKKFVKGRLEHQDEDPLKINCEMEIMQEQIDIIAYQFLKTKQNEITRNNRST